MSERIVPWDIPAQQADWLPTLRNCYMAPTGGVVVHVVIEVVDSVDEVESSAGIGGHGDCTTMIQVDNGRVGARRQRRLESSDLVPSVSNDVFASAWIAEIAAWI